MAGTVFVKKQQYPLKGDSSVIIVSTCVDYVQNQGRFGSALAPSPDPPQASG